MLAGASLARASNAPFIGRLFICSLAFRIHLPSAPRASMQGRKRAIVPADRTLISAPLTGLARPIPRIAMHSSVSSTSHPRTRAASIPALVSSLCSGRRMVVVPSLASAIMIALLVMLLLPGTVTFPSRSPENFWTVTLSVHASCISDASNVDGEC